MTDKHETLAAALAAFQAALPSVNKGATGQVGQNRNYKYADLADLTAATLPMLGSLGLSFSCKPTLNDSGRFVLAYTLRHVGGEFDTGEWPLPEDATPQQIGSATTYARRYALQAVTGVAPDEDDDGWAASEHAYNHGRPRQPAQRNGVQRPAQGQDAAPPTPPQAADPGNREALEELAETCRVGGYDRGLVADLFSVETDGKNIREAIPAVIRKFIEHLYDVDPTKLKLPAGAQS